MRMTGCEVLGYRLPSAALLVVYGMQGDERLHMHTESSISPLGLSTTRLGICSMDCNASTPACKHFEYEHTVAMIAHLLGSNHPVLMVMWPLYKPVSLLSGDWGSDYEQS